MIGSKSMNKRTIAVQIDSQINVSLKLLADIRTYKIECQLIAFKPNNVKLENIVFGNTIEVIDYPLEIDTMPKRKNFIIDYCVEHYSSSFLHIIENINLLKDPTTYINAIENTMDVFDYDIHFSTVTDGCNYLFNKFNPRLTIDIDDINIKQKLNLPDSISFTSHSNTGWIIYDINHLGKNVPKFDERFTIAMFIIIEYLARRKATRQKGQLYLMNQYLCISNEYKTFETAKIDNDEQPNQEKLNAENELFKSIKIDYSPDNNIDMVLNMFYEKLMSKINSKNI